MSADGLSIGISHTLSFVDSNGNVNVTGIESFNSKEDAPIDKFVQIDGTTRHPQYHQGWNGSFVIGRLDNFMDNYTATKESNYYAGKNQVDMTITETIKESNGNLSQFQYINCVTTLDDAGTWSGTSFVKQSVSFVASRKIPIS